MPQDTIDRQEITRQLNELARRNPKLKEDATRVDQKLTEMGRIATAPGASEKDKNDYDRYLKSLAKGLPKLTKGVIDATRAFRSGDPFAETAAVLDICSTLASTLGSLTSAGGPPGALVGALFSMVSMILSIWIPKGPSLKEEIEAIIRQVKAEEKLEGLRVAENSISRFKWTVEEKDENGKPKDTGWKPLNLQNGLEVTKIDEAAAWLTTPANQPIAFWPRVLAAQCRVFINLMQAVATSMANASTEDKAKSAARYLSAEWRIQLEFLQEVTFAAQNRGVLWYIGTNTGFYAGDNIQKASLTPLGGTQKRLSITTTKGDRGKSARVLHAFCVGMSDDIWHGSVEWPATSLSKSLVTSTDTARPLTNCRDVWATAGSSADDIYFYTAHGSEVRGYVLKDSKAVFAWADQVTDVESVRVIDFPDWQLDGGTATELDDLEKISFLVYGGCRGKSDVFVKAPDRTGYVPIPSSWKNGYSGIGVDQRYVWIFRPQGMACATHASIVRCLTKKIQQPSWMEHSPANLLYDGMQYDREKPGKIPALQGLIDLSPCDDGTLVAALYRRRVTQIPNVAGEYSYETKDTNGVYVGTCRIDPGKNTLDVDWTQLKDNQANRVQKVPIFCWPLVEGVMRSLQARLLEKAEVLELADENPIPEASA